MSNDALGTIVPVAGWPEERARAVAITGDSDPILPTPFRIGESPICGNCTPGVVRRSRWIPARRPPRSAAGIT